MKIKVKIAQHYPCDEHGIEDYAKQKLRAALKNTQRYIEDVQVRISSLNGTGREQENMCFIQLSIPGQTPVYIRSMDSNIFSAISEAVERAGQKSERRIRRRRCLGAGSRLTGARGKAAYRSGPMFASYHNV